MSDNIFVISDTLNLSDNFGKTKNVVINQLDFFFYSITLNFFILFSIHLIFILFFYFLHYHLVTMQHTTYFLDTNRGTSNPPNNSVIDEKDDVADKQEFPQQNQRSTTVIAFLAVILGVVALALIFSLVKIK